LADDESWGMQAKLSRQPQKLDMQQHPLSDIAKCFSHVHSFL
jgi:hypothetical protein